MSLKGPGVALEAQLGNLVNTQILIWIKFLVGIVVSLHLTSQPEFFIFGKLNL